MEKAAASWQKGVKVSICCFLPGTRAGVHQEMVSARPGEVISPFCLVKELCFTCYPQSDSVTTVLTLVWRMCQSWGFDSRPGSVCVSVHHRRPWCVGTRANIMSYISRLKTSQLLLTIS